MPRRTLTTCSVPPPAAVPAAPPERRPPPDAARAIGCAQPPRRTSSPWRQCRRPKRCDEGRHSCPCRRSRRSPSEGSSERDPYADPHGAAERWIAERLHVICAGDVIDRDNGAKLLRRLVRQATIPRRVTWVHEDR